MPIVATLAMVNEVDELKVPSVVVIVMVALPGPVPFGTGVKVKFG